MSGGAGGWSEPAAPDRDAAAERAPHFQPPDVRFHASWLDALSECQAEGRHDELDGALLEDPGEFARYCDALRSAVARPGEPDAYLARLHGTPLPCEWIDGYVPQTVLWWVAGDEYLGRLSLRHRLTPHLRYHGGNIGFEVRPSARRRGHATAMLAAALPLAASLGIRSARIDCAVDNVASRRVIERNGGVLDEGRDDSLFFWVPTG
jgi:predicted acetyltransferase